MLYKRTKLQAIEMHYHIAYIHSTSLKSFNWLLEVTEWSGTT